MKDWVEKVSELVIGKKTDKKKLYTVLPYMDVSTFCICCKILICVVCIFVDLSFLVCNCC